MTDKTRSIAFALILALAALPAVADPFTLFPVGFGYKSLEFSNGNKIMVGRFNTLHAVYQDGAIIKYTTSADGSSWTTPVGISAGYGTADHGSLAIDSAGNIGVVWVSNPNINGVGPIYYARKTHASTTWAVSQLVSSGAEPAIAGRSTTMYVAWTSIQKVQFASFSTLSPPPSMASGEILESSSCPNTGFRRPSITLINSPCKPAIPRVAALYYSDEQGTVGACQSLVTQVGPHVYQRNNTNSTWSMIYDNTISDAAAGSAVDPISLSISANFTTGDTFLAWSDEQTGVARTMLARGHGATWDTSTFDADRRHVHVRARSASNAPATEFRLAWTGNAGWFDEFFSWDTYYDTATWTGANPAWYGADLLSDYGGYTGRPQGIFWKRCASGQYSTTQAYFEAEGPCTSKDMATDFTTVTGCPATPTGPIIAAYPCKHAVVAVAHMPLPPGVVGTAVDTTELGVITKVGGSSATVTTEDGKIVTIAWRSGTVVAQSDNSLTLTSPRTDVSITSRDVTFEIEEAGYLKPYDPKYFEKGSGRSKC